VFVKDFTDSLPLQIGLWPPWVPAAAVGPGGGDRVLCLRDGVERFFITEINSPAGTGASRLPVLWDALGSSVYGDNTEGARAFNHLPSGANVLVLDGHVSFVRYPDAFRAQDAAPLVKEMSRYGLL